MLKVAGIVRAAPPDGFCPHSLPPFSAPILCANPAPVIPPAERQFVVAAEKDPVVQSFLTTVLAEAGVDKVRAFFMTANTRDGLATL